MTLYGPHESLGGEALCLVLDGHGPRGICGLRYAASTSNVRSYRADEALNAQNDIDRVKTLVSQWFADAHARAHRWLVLGQRQVRAALAQQQAL